MRNTENSHRKTRIVLTIALSVLALAWIALRSEAQSPTDSTRPTAPLPGSSVSSAGKPTLPSYSFDSREWAEYYPGVRDSSNSIPRGTASDRKTNSNPFSSSDVSPISGLDGKADGDLSGALRVASLPPSSREEAKLRPGLDLSPSYTKHLKYHDVCGVVVVQADFPLTEIGAILLEIEQLQRDLNLYMGVPAPKEKIELCLFKDEKSYTKFLKDYFPKAPRDRRALYIKLNREPGTLLVQRTRDFEIDLRHEMTHAIVHASIPVVPIWLDEGLAKYFELTSLERSANNPYLKTVRRNVRFGAYPTLHRLERLKDIGDMGGREYRDSWAWVHFLIHHSPDTHRLLAGYLKLLATLPQENSSDDSSRQETVDIPPLSLYLEDMMKNPREKFREHFSNWAVEE